MMKTLQIPLLALLSLLPLISVGQIETPVKNANVSLAYPVDNIKIDGDPSDWPANLIQYPISELQANRVDGTDDLKASFQVGYSKPDESVFILVEIQDDSHVTKVEEGYLSGDQDQLSVFLDIKHDEKGSGVNEYCFNELYKYIESAENSWDYGVRNPNWDKIQVASQRIGKTTYYEMQVLLDEGIISGRTLGVDFVIYDNDTNQNEPTRIAWIKGERKAKSPFKLGNILLVEDIVSLGIIEGAIGWKSESLGPFPDKVSIRSISNPTLWIHTNVDSHGDYKTQLPSGEYVVELRSNFYDQEDTRYKIRGKSIEVEVKPQSTTRAADMEIEILEPINLLPDQGILVQNPSDKYDRIDEFIQSYMDFYEIPGVSLAIIEEGKMSYYQTYGVKNYYEQQEVGSETIFEAASITKPVFAFAVCRLAEKGLIDLDKPLYKYLPFSGISHDERYKLITARFVLSHKTGFPNWFNGKGVINFTPGTKFGYSGEGFEYLKRVVEHITKKDIMEILEEEVLNPLKLDNFYFEKSDLLLELVANGHYYNSTNMANLPDEAWMAGCMHTKPDSFTQFALALLNREGLRPSTYSDMFTKHTTTDKYASLNIDGWVSHYGLGIQIEETPFGLAFGHGGNNGDFLCDFRVYEDLKMGYIVFTNSNTGDHLTNQALEQFLVSGRYKYKSSIKD